MEGQVAKVLERRCRLPRPGVGVGRTCALLALWLGTALAAGCRGRNEGAGTGEASATPGADIRADSTVALPVVGALVRRGDLVLSVRATGAVRAERQVTLRAETQGTVAEVAVRPGDRVERAQVLVRLDPRPFDVAVRQAEASLGEAQIRLQEALVGDDPHDSTEAARRRREGARIRAGVTGAEARLEGARLDRERATITAPFGGVADRVGVVVAQRLAAGEEIVRLVDLGSLIIEASVLEHDLPYVRTGGQAMVVPSASPDTRYRGTIEAVLPVVDTATRAGRVVVRVRTSDGRLRPGMYADVQLEASRLVARVLVPAGAVIERDGRTLVFRARAGRADWVYVPVGRSNGVETEILPDSVSGRPNVGPGDTVLVGGHLTLTHDAPIRVRLQEGKPTP
jgi:membrane fusion protein (multidrug efflux system)